MMLGLLYILLPLLVVHSKGQVVPLRCPKGITSFSATNSKEHFYQCNKDRTAVLTKCPPGHSYRSNHQSCRKAGDSDPPKPFDDKTLGRNVVLGALYDGKKNKFDISRSLWSRATIDANKFQYDRMETKTSFSADSSKEEKVDTFDISANLKLDFMSGAVGVEGAMRYLTDERASEQELNVEMMYQTTKYSETLPKYVEKTYPEECSNKDYTHVVTSITKGLGANLVFKYQLAEHEEQSNIYGMLKITVQAIPGLSIHGSGSVNLTHEQKSPETLGNLLQYRCH